MTQALGQLPRDEDEEEGRGERVKQQLVGI